MSSLRASAAALAVAAIAGLAAASARTAAAAHQPVSPDQILDVPPIPAEVARPLTFGFSSFAAHLAFLEAIQVFGVRHKHKLPVQQRADDRALQRLLTYVIDLDPKFTGAYRFTGNALPRETLDGKAYNVLATVSLLRRGIEARPDYWQTPFLLGFLESYYLGDTKEAARHIALAAKLPGSPSYLGLLATRLATDAGQLDQAEQMARTMAEETQDDEGRKEWEERLLDLKMERGVRAIEDADRRFFANAGRHAQSIGELVSSGALAAVPPEPRGGQYQLDPRTGEASSTAAPRLRVRGRKGATSGLEVH